MSMTASALRADAAPSSAFSPAPAFSLEGVSFRLGGKVLLQPLDLELPAGKSIALIGHNGSGKSTLLKLLGRQQEAASGTIRFQGEALSGWNARAFARKLAYLPQHTPVAPGMLVRELVALGRYPWHGALGRFGAADKAKVEEALARTGMEPFADRLVDTLSGGERQRAWLAMMVAQDAQCLLLDEPISALDIGHQLEVLGLIRDLVRDKGLTAITVLHDINMAARFCDHIVALHSGQKILEGSPADIMTSEALRRIYNVDMDVLPAASSGHPVALVR